MRQRDLSQEDARRDAATKKALTITLAREPEMGMLRTGERVVVFRGTEDGAARPLKGVFTVPLHRVENSEQGEADLDRKLRALGGGDELTLAGQWSKNTWQGRESWEFKAQHFAEGRHTLEQVLEKARVERGDQAPAVDGALAVEERAPATVRRPHPAREGGMGGI